MKIFSIIFFNAIGSFCYGQSWQWANDAIQTGFYNNRHITSDALGNVYTIGTFTGQFTIGTQTFIDPNGSTDYVITKHDHLGNLIWAKRGTGIDNDDVVSIATDGNSNIVFCGYTTNEFIYFDTDTAHTYFGGTESPFLYKLDSSGTVLWKQFGHCPEPTHTNYVTTDVDGNILLAGGFVDAYIAFGTDTLFNPVPTSNILSEAYLIKFSPGGNVLWMRKITGPWSDEINCIATDPWKNIYVSGNFEGPTSYLDSISIHVQDSTSLQFDLFLAKYNEDGEVQWAKSEGGYYDDKAKWVVADHFGNVYIGGVFNSNTLHFETSILFLTGISQSNYDLFIARFDSSGNFIWVKQGASIGNDRMYDAAVDTSGNIFVTGGLAANSNYALVFGNDSINNPAGSAYPAFVATFNANGRILCSNTISSCYYAQTGVAACILNNNAFVCSAFNISSVILDNDTLTGIVNHRTYLLASLQECNPCIHDTVPYVFSPHICIGDSFILPDGSTTNTSGTYTDTLTSTLGCDSIVIINLEVVDLVPIINQYGSELYVDSIIATFNWMNCIDSSLISGQYFPTYFPQVPGSYAVIESYLGCSDTSDCFFYDGIYETNFRNQFYLYPNPTAEIITVEYSISTSGTFSIYNLLGEKQQEIILEKNSTKKNIPLTNIPSGIYFCVIKTEDGKMYQQKLVVQK